MTMSSHEDSGDSGEENENPSLGRVPLTTEKRMMPIVCMGKGPLDLDCTQYSMVLSAPHWLTGH